MPPLIHHNARPEATSRCRAAVSIDTRDPPDPPMMTAGAMSSCLRSPARASACIADSESPVKQTSDSPQFGRSQMSTRLPSAASAVASSRTPGSSFVKRPPGVITHGRPVADDFVCEREPVDGCRCHGRSLMSTSMLNKDMLVVDADSHWCEPADLFTKLAPAAYKDRVPRVEEVDGQTMWVFDGHPIGRFSAGGGDRAATATRRARTSR